MDATAPPLPHRRRFSPGDFLRGYGALLGMVAVLLLVATIKPSFLSSANIGNVLRQSTVLIVIAFGLTVVLMLRGVDLSVAQITDAAALMAAALLIHGQPVWVAFAAPVLLGGLLGACNGLMMAYLGVPAIIGTLGTMFVIRSAELIYTKGSEPQILFTLPKAVTADFLFLGQKTLGTVPALIVLAVVMFGLVYALVDLTPFGRELCGKLGDDGGLKAAYRGGCPACQNLSPRAIRHERAYQCCPPSSARRCRRSPD